MVEETRNDGVPEIQGKCSPTIGNFSPTIGNFDLFCIKANPVFYLHFKQKAQTKKILAALAVKQPETGEEHDKPD